jgi:hypothetical protein
MLRVQLIIALISACLVITRSAEAALIVNGTFDTAPSEGDLNSNNIAINTLALGTWHTGDNNKGSGRNEWENDASLGGMAGTANLLQPSGTGADRSVSLVYVIDNTSNPEKGLATFSFDLLVADGPTNTDLVVRIFGWDTGETGPTVDGVDNENNPATNFINLGNSTQLFAETLIDNSTLQAAGGLNPATADDTFDAYSASVDVTDTGNTPFDFVGIVFVGWGNGISPTDNHMASLDNVSLSVAIPEPSTVTLAALGLLGLLGFRRRRRK